MLTEEDIYRVAEALSPVNKLVLQQFSPENTLDSQLKQERPWPQEKLEQVQRRVDQLLNVKHPKSTDGSHKNNQ
jgi:hypothetical protein